MSDDYYDMASPDIYPILKDNSRKNRRNMTLAESVLWDCLRTDLSEFRFRRQHIIGDYIVDFVCLSKQLVVEVDGEYHLAEDQMRLDEIRTEYLNSKGFYVLRFTNQQILNELHDVTLRIENELNNN